MDTYTLAEVADFKFAYYINKDKMIFKLIENGELFIGNLI